MTNRERIVRTLGSKETDRAPFCYWFGYMPWEKTLARWREESGIGDLDIEKYFGFEPYFQFVPVEYGPVPHFETKIIEQKGNYITQTDYRGLTYRDNLESFSIPEFIDNPVKTVDDWEVYKKERLQLRLEERTAKVEEFAERAKRVDAPIQIGNFPWGVFGTARDILGVERMMLCFYDREELMRDIMETYTSLWLRIYERVNEVVQIDHILLWEDMSGKQGSMISMEMVEEFMMPQYERIAEFCRRCNVAGFSVDSDGSVDELVPVMMRHGVNAYTPFEVQAGSDVEEYLRKYPELGIYGGLDKNALAMGREAIDKELEKCERMLAGGGYIPGFDHLIPPNVAWEDYEYAVNELRRMIGA